MTVSYKVLLELIMCTERTNEYNSTHIDLYTRIPKGRVEQKVLKVLYKCGARDVHVRMLIGSEMM